MENILNYIKEEKEKLDAKDARRRAEDEASRVRTTGLISRLVSKLKPLEELIINELPIEVKASTWGSSMFDVTINFGPKQTTNTLRDYFRISGRLAECESEQKFTLASDHLYQVEGVHLDHAGECKCSWDEMFCVIAAYFALRVQ